MMRRSSYRIIIAVACCGLLVAVGLWHEAHTLQCMRGAVEQALEMNRNFVPFTSDSTMRRVVTYFDHPLRFWVSANDRLRAHYALGCVYRDMHEAPLAIIEWEEAVACADTTSATCDYGTLFRVYGQMSETYMWQHLPEKELAAERQFSKYALLAGDTISSIRGILWSQSAYYAQHDTSAIFRTTDLARRLFLKLGMKKEASQVYPTAIQVAVEYGLYSHASSMMDIYEHESGLFDEKGNIIDSSRIQYHYYKGLYFLGLDEMESSEHEFRKLFLNMSHLVDAYRGLFFLYQQKRDIDSTFKYASLYERALEEHVKTINTNSVIQAEEMYNYSRHEKKAREAELSAHRWRAGSIIFILTGVVFSLFVYIYYRNEKQEKEKRWLELKGLKEKYDLTVVSMEKAQAEVALLMESRSENERLQDMARKKTEQIELLKAQLEDLRNQIQGYQDLELQQAAQESLITDHLHTIAKSHVIEKDGHRRLVSGRKLTQDEWEQLLEMTKENYKRLYLCMNESKLTDMQYKVCLLSRYGFKNQEIAVLIQTSTKTVSNIRTYLAKDIFKLGGAYELDAYLISL